MRMRSFVEVTVNLTDHLTDHHLRCRYCGSKDLEPGDMTTGGSETWVTFVCPGCGERPALIVNRGTGWLESAGIRLVRVEAVERSWKDEQVRTRPDP